MFYILYLDGCVPCPGQQVLTERSSKDQYVGPMSEKLLTIAAALPADMITNKFVKSAAAEVRPV